MRTTERPRPAGGATLDLALAQRADRKLHRYNMDLNGALAFIVAARGLPDLRNATHGDADRVADRQRAALRETAGRWEDGRNTAEIIAEIEGARTMGREVPFDPA